VNSFRKKNPEASFKEIAAAFKGQKDMSEKLASLSDDEIIGQIEKLSAVLRKRKGSCSLEEKEKRMSQEIEKLQSTVKELDAKLNEPDRKTVKSLSSVSESIPQRNLSSSEMMLNFLKGNLK
jgi:predicted nuclease with TOPRIM domain